MAEEHRMHVHSSVQVTTPTPEHQPYLDSVGRVIDIRDFPPRQWCQVQLEQEAIIWFEATELQAKGVPSVNQAQEPLIVVQTPGEQPAAECLCQLLGQQEKPTNMLSIYQRRSVFRHMLGLAHQLAHHGMERTAILAQVRALRDQEVALLLTDIQMRQQRGHLR
jgi:hypothetical protein